MRKWMIMTMVTLLAIGSLKAQIVSPVKWSYSAKKGADGIVTIYLKAAIEAPWHIYSVNQKPGGPERTSFTFLPSPAFVLLGKVVEPKAISKYEPVFGLDVNYFEHSVVFVQKIKLKAKQALVKGKVSFMACNESSCLPPDEVSFTIPVR